MHYLKRYLLFILFRMINIQISSSAILHADWLIGFVTLFRPSAQDYKQEALPRELLRFTLSFWLASLTYTPRNSLSTEYRRNSSGAIPTEFLRSYSDRVPQELFRQNSSGAIPTELLRSIYHKDISLLHVYSFCVVLDQFLKLQRIHIYHTDMSLLHVYSRYVSF